MTDASYVQGEFCWYEIGTRDTRAAKEFYAALFGWRTEDMPMGNDGDIYTMLRLGDKDIAGLYELKGEMFEGVPPHWLSYIWVDDVSAAATKVAQLGGRVLNGPMDMPDVGSMAVIEDPTGAVVAIFHGTGHPGAARLSPAQGTVGWVELATHDTDRARDFYRDLVGWGVTLDTETVGMPYTLFSVAEKGIAGMMAMEGDQWAAVPPHWMPYFNVDDCDAAAARVKQLGGDIRVPPTDIPNVGRFAVVADPTGAVFDIAKFVEMTG
jgi:predicted enzyme related to lactoylglutathione lyase